MNSFINFIANSYTEFRDKVEWPKWSQLQSSLVVVAISALVLAVFTFIVDSAFRVSINNIYSIFIDFFN